MSLMPRLMFAFGAFCLNLVHRSLHCQAGRPGVARMPPGWA
jgi:hypothetical protein